MKILLISDIHDNEHNLREVIKLAIAKNVEEVIALGDYCYPGIIRYFATLNFKFRCIFGNNDGDRAGMMQDSMNSNGKVIFSRGEFDQYEISGKKIFVTHYPQIAEAVALSGKYSAVFYGHDHVLRNEKLPNNCLLVNPGEICGTKTATVTFAIWDSETNTAEIFDVKNKVLVNK